MFAMNLQQKFSGVPRGSALEKKIKRCVKRVMKDGKSESSAIAICRASIEKREVSMSDNKTETVNVEEFLAQADPEGTKMPAAEQKEAEEDIMTPEFPVDADDVEEKFYDSDIGWTMATDFDELDSEREAMEQAREQRQVSRDAMSLVSNVVYDHEMSADEKSEKISEIGKQMAERTMAIVKKEVEDDEQVAKKFDFELAELESIAQYIGMRARIGAKVSDLLSKEDELPDEAFAYVDGDDRYLPIHDEKHVRASLAKAIQMIRKDKDADIARKSTPKLKEAAQSFGIHFSQDSDNALIVEKGVDGKWRWLGVVSGNFIDRDGDILTEQAHKEFVDYLDSVAKSSNLATIPEFWSWHTAGTARKSAVDVWGYEHGFLFMGGELTEKEAIGLLSASRKEKLGMSHQFFVLERSAENPKHILKYRTFEVSDLPLAKAAFPWTNVDVQSKENQPMSDKLEYLKTVMGEDRFSAYMSELEAKQAALREDGVQEKEADEQVEQEPTTEEKGFEAVTLAIADRVAQQVLEKVRDELGMEELSELIEKEIMPQIEQIPQLAEAVSAQKEAAEDVVADMIEAPISKRFAWQRPSESDENLIDEKSDKDQELLDSEPGIKGSVEDNWLAAHFKVEPIQEVTQ